MLIIVLKPILILVYYLRQSLRILSPRMCRGGIGCPFGQSGRSALSQIVQVQSVLRDIACENTFVCATTEQSARYREVNRGEPS